VAFPKKIHQKMNEQILWILIEQTQVEKSSVYKQSQLLMELLSEWSVPLILKFEKAYWALIQRSYDADLWAAAYVLNDGCSQEEFLNFRNWLLLQGQSTFRKTVEDPESITEWLDLPMQNFIQYPDLHNKIIELIAIKSKQPIEIRHTEENFELSGDYWENDLEVVDKVPALCKKMGWGNKVPKGNWKTDDTPSYNLFASGSFY
jgi:hypothetical protein